MRKCRSINLIVTISMVIAVALFLPGLSLAGSLEPSGSPAPTMKTLDQIPPTWDQKLSANDGPMVNGTPDPCNSSRFKCVLDNTAVLDKETGLVWEKSPSATRLTWGDAIYYCNRLTTGGRLGWRLPTVQQLASLVDPTVPSPGPTLPGGHPFNNVQSGSSSFYWSSTGVAYSGSAGVPGFEGVWGVYIGEGVVNVTAYPDTPAYVWCVRGGQTADFQ